jgi:aspartyl-tRNA(Asn)/glutamyl-tRNA(Gln) amidotransferase subunit A
VSEVHDLAFMGLTEVAQAIALRQVSALEVTQACVQRATVWQASRKAFIRLDAEPVLAAAQKADAQLAQRSFQPGPLHGVPLAHKDLFYRAGQVSTCGSLIRRDWRASTTASCLSQLDEAGAMDLGTLNMSEFAGGPTGHNIHHGHCASAYHPEHIAGGSSSGSGVAVGAGLVFGSLGTDTGGSIRLPASANGVLGLKPTYGRISRHGVMPRAWSLDHVGVLARRAVDVARLLRCTAGHDSLDPTSSDQAVPDYEADLHQSVRGVRLGVPDAGVMKELEPGVQAMLEFSLGVLADCGTQAKAVQIEDMTPYFRCAETIIKSEAASIHGPWLRQRPQDYTPLFRSRTEAGLLIPATQYIDALRWRTQLSQQFMNASMAHIDVLLMPCMPYALPTIAASDVDSSGEAVRALIGRITMFTRPFNLMGLPVVQIPAGFCPAGLPWGFQLVGRPFQEGLLLRLAHHFMAQTPSLSRRPAL